MRLFLDTSTVLAACGSTAGASREVFRRSVANGWSLVVTPYVLSEVEYNLPDFPPTATTVWKKLGRQLEVAPDVFTLDRPAVFGPAKDRPILFSALAWADALLTLDQGDFAAVMSSQFYGLRVLRPGHFLEEERAAGRLR